MVGGGAALVAAGALAATNFAAAGAVVGGGAAVAAAGGGAMVAQSQCLGKSLFTTRNTSVKIVFQVPFTAQLPVVSAVSLFL